MKTWEYKNQRPMWGRNLCTKKKHNYESNRFYYNIKIDFGWNRGRRGGPIYFVASYRKGKKCGARANQRDTL